LVSAVQRRRVRRYGELFSRCSAVCRRGGCEFNSFPRGPNILVVLRAGGVEELFYRGYAIERLQFLGLNRWWAGVSPLLIFGIGHATNGWANVVLALGAVLTAVYLWRRDLAANMIGHFMVDFISVLLARFLAHS